MDDLVTIFRSADDDAELHAQEVADALRGRGIECTVLDDDAPGVVEGSYEVRVPQSKAAIAEKIVAAIPNADALADVSRDLDMVTVFSSGDGTTAEMEARTVQNLLQANGIYAVLVGGDVPIASLNQEVRVARELADDARRIISEARATGPSDAARAQRETESLS